MKTFTAAAIALAAITFLAVTPCVAATSTTQTMTVSATVQATCSFTAAPLAFGTYTGAQLDQSSSLSVSCTNTTPYTVALNAGTGTGATVAARKMTGASATLTYSLYQDSAHGTVWGQTTSTDTVAGAGTGSAQTLTVYGRIPAGQLVNPGAYSDTVTATLTY